MPRPKKGLSMRRAVKTKVAVEEQVAACPETVDTRRTARGTLDPLPEPPHKPALPESPGRKARVAAASAVKRAMKWVWRHVARYNKAHEQLLLAERLHGARFRKIQRARERYEGLKAHIEGLHCIQQETMNELELSQAESRWSRAWASLHEAEIALQAARIELKDEKIAQLKRQVRLLKKSGKQARGRR